MRTRVLVVMGLAACHPTNTLPSGNGPLLPNVQVKSLKPLEARSISRDARQAILFGTDDHDNSTVLPLSTPQQNVSVDALWLRPATDKQPAAGGITPTKLSTTPQTSPDVRIVITQKDTSIEEAQTRSSVWIAAAVAASTLNKDLSDYDFRADLGGPLDAASASGLFAAADLAAITGMPIDATVAMTGTINPDGTIGPVVGIPEKVAAAIEHGKKRVGVPIGTRMSRSEASGEMVDVVELAKQRGAEAIELADVHDAYRLLTGKDLPRPAPVTEADMAIDAETAKALDTKYTAWRQRLAVEWASLLQLDQAGRLPPALDHARDHAKRLADEAERLHAKGQHAAAYDRLVDAYVEAHVTSQTYDIVTKANAGKVNDAIAALQQATALGDQTKKAFEVIRAIQPKTLGGHLQMMSAFQTGLHGWNQERYAADTTRDAVDVLRKLSSATPAELGIPESQDAVVAAVMPAVRFATTARTDDERALEVLDFQKEDAINYLCSIPNMKRLATSFQTTALGATGYFEELYLAPLAQSWGAEMAQASSRFARLDPDYGAAFVAARITEWQGLPQDSRASWGESSFAWNILVLAATELAYYDSAQLIAKYYSLGVDTDGDGRIDRVENDKAFAALLDAAERTARANARQARVAAGAIPIQSRLAYQLAAVERDGSLDERLDALEQYWLASAYAQTAVMLARN